MDISSPLAHVSEYTQAHTHTCIQAHCFYFYSISSGEKLSFFLNQILFSINIQKCSKRLKGEVFFGCYFTHIDINRSKTILDSSGEAGIAVGTGSWLLSLPVFLFQCCLESAAQRLLKAKSLLLACDSFSLPFILLKCA